MELALTDGIDAASAEINSTLTKEQVTALAERERRLYGDGGDVGRELPRLRERMEHELYLRLMPGYVRQYLERVAPLLRLDCEGDLDGVFSLRPRHFGAMDCLLPILETYPERARDRFTVQRPGSNRNVIWLHPGEPVFETIRAEAAQRLKGAGMRGAVFVDPDAENPYLLHLARITVRRRSDPELEDFNREEILETRLVAAQQQEGGDLEECPVERLLLLKPARGGLPPAAQRLAMDGESRREETRSFISERVARELGLARRRKLMASLAERERFLLRGYDYREAELATARARHRNKAKKGNRKAIEALEDVKSRQRELGLRREQALAHLRREPDLIGAGDVEFIAHVLVVPSQDPLDKQRHDADVEEIAMGISRAYEEAAGATVHDVHTPDRARAVGLTDYPGFDMLSIRPDGERRGIEVKGRAAVGDVEVSANEWARACNLRDGYWIYAVYDCAGPAPRLARVRDPFGCLLAKAKGSMILNPNDVLRADVGEEL